MPTHVVSLLLVHAAATLAMTGIIWFVQVVHYPLLARVGPASLPAYAAAHARRTTWVVAPPMLAELATALALAWRPPPPVGRALPYAGLALLVAIWSSTVFLQVPRHEALQRPAGSLPQAHAALVATNWIRTVTWTARSALALTMLACTLP